MSEWLDNLITQLRALPPGRQIVLLATTAGSLAFFGWLSTGAASPEYRALYRGLAEDEIARVADVLAVEKIEYQIADGGTAILVQSTEVPEARMRVARKGLPGGSGVGYELFDAPAFGVTDFVHRVNYVRAVQGELGRSIEQLENVERARVQVVIPQRRNVLDSRESRASASVVVALAAGRGLEHEQVQAIVHLVASSIESLDPKEVTVVDGAGRLLAPLDDASGTAHVSASGTSYQQRLEAQLAGRVESMLERTVGVGNVTARVNAMLDWSESETTAEVYDPESQIARSEQRSTETANEGPVGGVPGVGTNLPDAGGGLAGGSPTSERTSETINYEISKTVSRTVQPMGRIERLSLAVLVADKPGEGENAEPVPWSPEDLALFEGLAREAVGFDAQRGDRITIRSAPFRISAPILDEPSSFWPQWSPLLVVLGRGITVLVALLLFARLIVKPILATLPDVAPVEVPVRVGDLEAQLAAEGAAGGALTAGDSRADDGPDFENGVRALRNWLNQG